MKPPPPVRRTASISSTRVPPTRRPVPARQLSDGGEARGGRQGQQPALPPKPAHLQRQRSAESPVQQSPPPVFPSSPNQASVSSGSGQYAVPTGITPSAASANLLQSLNAQLASLNQHLQQQPPPGTANTYVGHSQTGDPAAPNLMPPPGPAPAEGQNGVSMPHLQSRETGQQASEDASIQSRQWSGGSGPSGQGRPSSQPGDSRAVLSPVVQEEGEDGEDFPLPPTQEELEEMETTYARPPPITPKPAVSTDFMKELRRRMSAEESSEV